MIENASIVLSLVAVVIGIINISSQLKLEKRLKELDQNDR